MATPERFEAINVEKPYPHKAGFGGIEMQGTKHLNHQLVSEAALRLGFFVKLNLRLD